MAYGHCGDLNHGDAYETLRRYREWQRSAEDLEKAYNSYKSTSGNALLWAGWNYWDPTRRSQGDRRVIQVVLSDDLLASNADLVAPERTLLEHGGQAILTVEDFLQAPIPEFPNEVPLGAHRSNDGARFSEEMVMTRRLLYNLWDQVFVPSVRIFNEAGEATIVDHMRHEHAAYEKGEVRSPARDLAALFRSDDLTQGEVDDQDGVRDFHCTQEWTESLWLEVARLMHSPKSDLSGGPSLSISKASGLVEAWRNLADTEGSLKGHLGEPLKTLAAALGPHVEPSRQAYVIFQHLALFDRFILSPNQYVFPLVFGRHVFVAFMSMKKPLHRDEIGGWRQVVAALFGGLIVELLSQKYTQIEVRWERRRVADEQRMMLSHSLPKSVFKPAEYFATRLLERSAIVDARSETREGVSLSNSLAPAANALVFLLQKGQAEISDYAQDEARTEEASAPINVDDVCREITNHSRVLSEFFVSGYLDRCAELSDEGVSARDRALDSTELKTLTPDTELGPPLVRLNRGLLSLHLWNVIDNAFRHAQLGRSGLTLTFEVTTETERLVLGAQSSGERIVADRAEVLNALFTEPRDSAALKEARYEVQRWSTEVKMGTDLEGENRGVGLYRFSDYLGSLWEKSGQPGATRGKVEAIGNGTRFEFYFPRASE